MKTTASRGVIQKASKAILLPTTTRRSSSLCSRPAALVVVHTPFFLRRGALGRPQLQQQQLCRRSISTMSRILNPRVGVNNNTSNYSMKQQQDDIDHAVSIVRHHDPAGYLPGRLLPQQQMQVAYYAVRSFWIETGLRFGTTALVKSPNSTPLEHLEWWDRGVDAIYKHGSQEEEEEAEDAPLPDEYNHPTLRLLLSILQQQHQQQWQRQHFDNILAGRKKDLDVKQYDTLSDLKLHSEQSCGSLIKLVMESSSSNSVYLIISQQYNPQAYEAARLVGMCHGLTNALRTSIPVVSITGKLIVPQELTSKYGVKSPRYLLSALGQGDDEECIMAMQNAIKDVVEEAWSCLNEARSLRQSVLNDEPNGNIAVAALLPGIASETFLNRLTAANYQLTDRNLRNVSLSEHIRCSGRMVYSYYKQQY